MQPETSPVGTERYYLQNRLITSALFYFGTNTHVRNTMRNEIKRFEQAAQRQIKTEKDLRAALGIRNDTLWNQFLTQWFQDNGITREFHVPIWNAKRPDIKETEAKLEEMKKNPGEAPKGVFEEVAPTAKPNNDEAFDRALASAEKAVALADKLEKEKQQLMADLSAAKTTRKGPLEIVIKKEGSKKEVKLHKAHFKLPDLLARVKVGIHVYLVGPAGSGKTTAAEQVGEALDLPFGFMSVGPQTTKTDILGFIAANGKYIPTEFRKRFEEGGIFLFDEIDAGNPGVLTCINAALANGWAAFPDGMVKRHEDFRCIAAGNTFGTGPDRQYVGRQEMDAASIDRFNFLEWPYDEGLELAIAEAIDKDLAKDWVAHVQKFRAQVAQLNVRHVVSPRASINGVKLLKAGVDRQSVLDTQLYKSLKPADVNRINATYLNVK